MAKKIKKTIKGEVIPYYVKFISNRMKAEVRYWSSDEPVIGTITNDFKYIILPDTFLSPYITDYGYVKVGKLKLDRYAQIDAKDYNKNYFESKVIKTVGNIEWYQVSKVRYEGFNKESEGWEYIITEFENNDDNKTKFYELRGNGKDKISRDLDELLNLK